MPSNTFHIEIVSPEGMIFKDDVNQVTLPTPNGEITILPNHTSLFTKVLDGEVKIVKDSNEIYIVTTGGFLEVDRNKSTLLSDYAVEAKDIQVAKAEEARKRAQALLKEKREKQDFVLVEKDLKKAILELKIAEKVRKRQRV